MFAKFATAKNREMLNPLKVSSNGCYLPENNTKDVKECSPHWDSNHRPLDSKPNYKSDTLWLSYRASWSLAKKILMWFANHLFREYRERTTPSRIFVPCNLKSCRVVEFLKWVRLHYSTKDCNVNRKILVLMSCGFKCDCHLFDLCQALPASELLGHLGLLHQRR